MSLLWKATDRMFTGRYIEQKHYCSWKYWEASPEVLKLNWRIDQIITFKIMKSVRRIKINGPRRWWVGRRQLKQVKKNDRGNKSGKLWGYILWFWGSDGGPHGPRWWVWGPWSPTRWVCLIECLVRSFWESTSGYYPRLYMLNKSGKLWGYILWFWGSDGGPYGPRRWV